MISAVIFDFGQTLADASDAFRSAEKEAQRRLSEAMQLPLREDFVDTYRKIRKEFHARSDFSRKAMWEEVYRTYGKIPGEGLLDELEESYWNKIEEETVLFPEVVDVLGKLRESYALALITNTQGQKDYGKHRMSRFPELEDFFKVVIVAGERGIPAKPDRRPFLLCLERLGISASEAVYVGDDWRIDIRGAMNIGMQPIWLQHRSFSRNWPEAEAPVPTIDGLEKLLELEMLLS